MRKLLCILFFVFIKCNSSYSVNIKFTTNEFANFVGHAYLQFLATGRSEKLPLIHDYQSNIHSKFIHKANKCKCGSDSFFKFMFSCNSIDDLCLKINNLPLNEVEKQKTLDLIDKWYSQYSIDNLNNKVDSIYMDQLRSYDKKNNNLLSTFLEDVACFYGLDKFPYEDIIVYVIPSHSNNGVDALFVGDNIVLSLVSDHLDEYWGVLAHELAHLCFEFQPNDVKNYMYNFYNNSKNLMSSLAYGYLNEGLATAIGNGVFMKKLCNKTDIAYNNIYIRTFANALYPLVSEYINEKKSFDYNFLNKSVELFQGVIASFDNIEQHLELLCSSCSFILYGSLDRDKIWKLFRNQFSVYSSFTGKYDNIGGIIDNITSKYYKEGCPVVSVLNKKEAKRLSKIYKSHPLLMNLDKFPSIKEGFTLCSDKFNRQYLFFIVSNEASFETLLKALKDKQAKHFYN